MENNTQFVFEKESGQKDTPKALVKSSGNKVLDVIQSDAFKQQLAMALPKHMTPDRMARIALTELRKTPKLLECDPKSLCGAVIQSAQLGLEIGSSLGQVYLIPYGKECQFQIGYKGLIDLALRSGKVQSIMPRTVKENDVFEMEYGLEEKLKHIPAKANRGKEIGFYAVAKFKDGGSQFCYMDLEEIDRIRDTSKASKHGPWVSHYESMAMKGLALDTKIPTPNGWKKMEELQEGDEVFDINGEPTTIIAVSEIKNLPCFKITFSNGEYIICDDEHLWLARVAHRNAHRLKYSEKTTNELYEALEDGQSVTIPMQGKLDLPEKDLPIDPYLFGYWLGNGNKIHANITCGQEDLDFITEQINKSKYKLGAIRKDPRNNSCSIGINDGFRIDLMNLGVFGNKFVPEIYLRSSIPQRRALLQGLMDSDGHIDKDRGRAHFTNTNINIANAVAELVYSLGDTCHRYTKRRFGYDVECVYHYVGWKPSFCCIRNPRKIQNYKPREVKAYRSIKKIEKIPSVPTKCIAVESETKTYLAGESMAVTHNTVIKRLIKYMNLSIELNEAISLDDQAEAGVEQKIKHVAAEEDLTVLDVETN